MKPSGSPRQDFDVQAFLDSDAMPGTVLEYRRSQVISRRATRAIASCTS